jgi:hypothetical protein
MNKGDRFPQSIASQKPNSFSKSIKQIISISLQTLHRRVQYVLTLKITRVIFISKYPTKTKRHHFRVHSILTFIPSQYRPLNRIPSLPLLVRRVAQLKTSILSLASPKDAFETDLSLLTLTLTLTTFDLQSS